MAMELKSTLVHDLIVNVAGYYIIIYLCFSSVLSAIEFVKEDDKIKRTRDSNRRSAIVK